MAVDFEKRGPCAVVKINRPEARNAVNGDVARGIEAAIDEIEADDGIWVGILTGEPPVFCAGADLKEINAGNAGALATKRGGFGGVVQRERTKPLIAAVDGPALAGDPIAAEQAHSHGLVNRLVEPGKALDGAMALAEQVCANAPVAVRESRAIVLAATHAPDEVGWKMSIEGMATAMSSEDFSEGLTAFIEKRPPRWKGR